MKLKIVLFFQKILQKRFDDNNEIWVSLDHVQGYLSQLSKSERAYLTETLKVSLKDLFCQHPSHFLVSNNVIASVQMLVTSLIFRIFRFCQKDGIESLDLQNLISFARLFPANNDLKSHVLLMSSENYKKLFRDLTHYFVLVGNHVRLKNTDILVKKDIMLKDDIQKPEVQEGDMIVVEYFRSVLRMKCEKRPNGRCWVEVPHLKLSLSKAPENVFTLYYQKYGETKMSGFFARHQNVFFIRSGKVGLVEIHEKARLEATQYFCTLLETSCKDGKVIWLEDDALRKNLLASGSRIIQDYLNEPRFFQLTAFLESQDKENQFIVSGSRVSLTKWFNAPISEDSENNTVFFFIHWFATKFPNVYTSHGLEISCIMEELYKAPVEVLTFLSQKCKGNRIHQFLRTHSVFVVSEGLVKVEKTSLEQFILSFLCKTLKKENKYFIETQNLLDYLAPVSPYLASYLQSIYGHALESLFTVTNDSFIVVKNFAIVKSELSVWRQNSEKEAIEFFCTLLETLNASTGKYWFDMSSVLGCLTQKHQIHAYFSLTFRKGHFQNFFKCNRHFIVSDKKVARLKWFIQLPAACNERQAVSYFMDILSTNENAGSNGMMVHELHNWLHRAPNEVVSYLCCKYPLYDGNTVVPFLRMHPNEFEVTPSLEVKTKAPLNNVVINYVYEFLKERAGCWYSVSDLQELLNSIPADVISPLKNESLHGMLKSYPEKFIVRNMMVLARDGSMTMATVNKACAQFYYNQLEEKQKATGEYWISISSLPDCITEGTGETVETKTLKRFLELQKGFIVSGEFVALDKWFSAFPENTLVAENAVSFFLDILSTETGSHTQFFEICRLKNYLWKASVEVNSFLARYDNNYLLFFKAYPTYFVLNKDLSVKLNKKGFERVAQTLLSSILMSLSSQQEIPCIALRELEEHVTNSTVKGYLKKKYKTDFAAFLRSHSETFLVLENKWVIHRSHYNQWKEKCCLKAVEFFSKILEKEHQVKGCFLFPASLLHEHMCEKADLLPYFHSILQTENSLCTFFRKHKEFVFLGGTAKFVTLRHFFVNKLVTKNVEIEAVDLFHHVMMPYASSGVDITCLTTKLLEEVPDHILAYLCNTSSCSDPFLYQFLLDHSADFKVDIDELVYVHDDASRLSAERKAVNFFHRILRTHSKTWHSMESLIKELHLAPKDVMSYFQRRENGFDLLTFFVEHPDIFIVEKDRVTTAAVHEKYKGQNATPSDFCYSILESRWKTFGEVWTPLSMLENYYLHSQKWKKHFNTQMNGEKFVNFFKSHGQFELCENMVSLREFFLSCDQDITSMVRRTLEFFFQVLSENLNSISDDLDVHIFKKQLWKAPKDVYMFLRIMYPEGDYCPFFEQYPSFFIVQNDSIKLQEEGCQLCIIAQCISIITGLYNATVRQGSWVSVKDVEGAIKSSLVWDYIRRSHPEGSLLAFLKCHPDFFYVITVFVSVIGRSWLKNSLITAKCFEYCWQKSNDRMKLEAVQFCFTHLEKLHESQRKHWLSSPFFTAEDKASIPLLVFTFIETHYSWEKLMEFFASEPETFAVYSGHVAVQKHLKKHNYLIAAKVTTYVKNTLKEYKGKYKSSLMPINNLVVKLEEAPIEVRAHLDKDGDTLKSLTNFLVDLSDMFVVSDEKVGRKKWMNKDHKKAISFFKSVFNKKCNFRDGPQALPVAFLISLVHTQKNHPCLSYLKDFYPEKELQFFLDNPDHFIVLPNGEVSVHKNTTSEPGIQSCVSRAGLSDKNPQMPIVSSLPLSKSRTEESMKESMQTLPEPRRVSSSRVNAFSDVLTEVISFFQMLLERCYEMYDQTSLEISELLGYLHSEASAEVFEYCKKYYADGKLIEFFKKHSQFVVSQTSVSLKKTYNWKVPENESMLLSDALAPVIFDDSDKAIVDLAKEMPALNGSK